MNRDPTGARWTRLAIAYLVLSPAPWAMLFVVRRIAEGSEGWGGWAMSAGLGRAVLITSALLGAVGLYIAVLARRHGPRAVVASILGAVVSGSLALWYAVS